jgi:hypothetical protein
MTVRSCRLQIRDLTLAASRWKADESKGRLIVKRLISAIALAFVCLATAAVPASADPVRHFGTFTIHCGGVAFVLSEKPGSSNVVTVNGMPSNSISILMGLTVKDPTGATVDEFHKPYALNQGDRIVVCQDTFDGFEFIAEVKFTPAR